MKSKDEPPMLKICPPKKAKGLHKEPSAGRNSTSYTSKHVAFKATNLTESRMIARIERKEDKKQEGAKSKQKMEPAKKRVRLPLSSYTW